MIDFLVGTGFDAVQFMKIHAIDPVERERFSRLEHDFASLARALNVPLVSCSAIHEGRNLGQIVSQIDPLMAQMSPSIREKWLKIQNVKFE